MYKITVQGLELESFKNLNNKTGELKKLINKLRKITPFKILDGYRITNNLLYNIGENDFLENETIKVVETNNVNCYICIKKID